MFINPAIQSIDNVCVTQTKVKGVGGGGSNGL
jgi:hypothetical protein